MAKEELLFRMSMFEQESKKIQEQIQLVNQQIQEFEVLKLSLDALDKIKEKESKEILANLGKGIFFNSQVTDKNLFVNIGCGIVVKRKPQETKEIVDRQIKQLEEIKGTLLQEVQHINMQMQQVIEQAQEVN